MSDFLGADLNLLLTGVVLLNLSALGLLDSASRSFLVLASWKLALRLTDPPLEPAFRKGFLKILVTPLDRRRFVEVGVLTDCRIEWGTAADVLLGGEIEVWTPLSTPCMAAIWGVCSLPFSAPFSNIFPVVVAASKFSSLRQLLLVSKLTNGREDGDVFDALSPLFGADIFFREPICCWGRGGSAPFWPFWVCFCKMGLELRRLSKEFAVVVVFSGEELGEQEDEEEEGSSWIPKYLLRSFRPGGVRCWLSRTGPSCWREAERFCKATVCATSFESSWFGSSSSRPK